MHLDNVIWRALTTRQVDLGHHHGAASKFDSDVSVLGGFGDGGAAALAGLLRAGEQVGLFLDAAIAVPGLELVSSAPLLQMIRDRDDVPSANVVDAIALAESDVPQMLELTELTKPGPFNRRTREMGDYLGVRDGGKLIAMTGQRLRVPGFIEISAVCTHPDHLGRGHAAALMAVMIRRIVGAGERAFLHVRPENARAVALYERLGFERRWVGRYVIMQRI